MKKRLIKMLALATAGVLLFGLTACAPASTPSDGTTSSTTTTTASNGGNDGGDDTTNGGNDTTNGGDTTTNGGNTTTNGGNTTTNGGNTTTNNSGNTTTNGGNTSTTTKTTTTTTKTTTSTTGNSQLGDGFKPVLRFTVASDPHVNGAPGCIVRVEDWVKGMTAYADTNPDGYGKLDAVAITGDLVNTLHSDKDHPFKQIYDVFKRNLKTDTQKLVALGNHDYDTGAITRTEFADLLGEPNRHVVINGFHFITVSTDFQSEFGSNTNGNGSGWDYGTATAQWLDAELAKAKAEGGENKPIFVMRHVGSTNTVAGSCDCIYAGSSVVLDSVLKKYPNVVDFSGHSHFPTNDEHAIHQKDWTSIVTGSTFHTGSSIARENGTSLNPINNDSAQVWLVEVDKDNRMRLRVWDVIQKKFVGKAHYINSFKKSGFTYTEGRYTNNDIFFASDAKLEVTKTSKTSVTLRFPTVPMNSIAGRVYRVVIKKGDTVVKTKTFVDKYYNGNYGQMTTVTFDGLTANTTYTAEVYALNSGYCIDIVKTKKLYTSKPLTCTFTAADKVFDAVKPNVLDLTVNASGKSVSDSSANNMTPTVVGTPTFSHDATIGMDIVSFSGDKNTINAIKLSDYKDMAERMANHMTFEAYFRIDAKDSGSVIAATDQGGFGLSVADNIIKFQYADGTGANSGYETVNMNYTVGEWYHLVAIFNNGTFTCYLNGTKVQTITGMESTLKFPVRTSSDNASRVVYLGADTNWEGGAESPAACSVAFVKIYDRALAESEIKVPGK